MLDSLHRALVGHDVFYFSDIASREAFLKDPLRTCGPLTDPVTLQRFRPTRGSPRMSLNGRLYVFRSDSTRRVFASMPDTFAVRRNRGM